MEMDRTWYTYENGTTVGRRGPAEGSVRRDEEFGDEEEPEDADARATLEALTDGTFAVTANLYGGWLQETAIFATEETANVSFEDAKSELARLADLIPDEDDKNIAAQVTALNQEVATFVARFGV